MSRTGLSFGCGVMLALVAGWLVFPRVLSTHQRQPLEFRHQRHADKSGTADCTACHELRPDGVFAGIPRNETCAGCHAAPMGTTVVEATLVNGFVKTGRETPWLVYSRQPANVRFPHAVHVKRAGLPCKTCHGTEGASDVVPAYEQDRISGYSDRVMTMSDCEDCHRKKGVEVGCLGCHQ